MRAPSFLLPLLVLLCLFSPSFGLGEKYRKAHAGSGKAPSPAAAPPPPLSTAPSPTLALERNNLALERAYAGDLNGALALFEDAVRLHAHPEYISNVGVTLMRLGRAFEAKRNFEEALRIDPNFQNAMQNLRELVDWMKNQGMLDRSYDMMDGVLLGGVKVELDVDFDDEAPTPTPKPRRARRTATTSRNSFGHLQHHTEALPRVAFKDLDSPAMKEFAFGRRPFVITGLQNSTSWALSKAMNDWSFKYFAAKYGDAIVDFYPHNMPVEDVKPLFASLATAVAEAKNPSGQYRTNPDFPGTYIMWNVNKLDDWVSLLKSLGPIPSMFRDFQSWMNECFPSAHLRDAFSHITHWHMILLGSQGAGMFNHWDIMQSASWQAQITGRKLWHLCSPDNDGFMYSAGRVDMFNPDYDEFPLVRHAACFLDVVEAGEFVFYPAGWWHQTENLAEENIAVSGSVVDANCYAAVQAEIEKECVASKKRFAFNQDVCGAMREHCFSWWRDAFTGSFTSSPKTCPVT